MNYINCYKVVIAIKSEQRGWDVSRMWVFQFK